MLKRIDTTLREMYPEMKEDTAYLHDLSTEPYNSKKWDELHRCRDRLHELREHPDYEYTTSIDNRDRGDGWRRNTHVGLGGIAGGRWHWMRRKGDDN